MRIERRFTKDGQSPYAEIEFRLTTSEIRRSESFAEAGSASHDTAVERRDGIGAARCRGYGDVKQRPGQPGSQGVDGRQVRVAENVSAAYI